MPTLLVKIILIYSSILMIVRDVAAYWDIFLNIL